MLNSTDDLFNLIKSLTKNEKRFFKIFSKRHGNNDNLKYNQLFNIYDGLDFYDKSLIDKLIKKNKLDEHIRYLKHQLQLHIIRSLNIYHYKNSSEVAVHSYLQNAEIFFTKGLFDFALNSIEQAKQIAEANDLDLILLECIRKEKKITKELYLINKIEHFATLSYKTEQQLLLKYLHTTEMHQIKNSLFLLRNDFDGKYAKKLNTSIEQLEEIVLNIHYENDASFETLETELATKSYLYLSKEDYANALIFQQKLVALYEQNAAQQKNNKSAYLSVLYNQLVSCFLLRKYNEVERSLNQLDDYRVLQNNRLTNLKLFNYLHIGLAYYNLKGGFNKSISYESIIIKGLTEFNHSVHVFAKISLYLHLATAFFGKNEFEKSIKWINRVLEEQENDEIKIHQAIAKILLLILLFEQKRFTYLVFTAKEIEEEESQLQCLAAISKFFLQNEFNETNNVEQNKLFEELKLQMELILENDEERVVFDVFDILIWIDSKIFSQSYQYLTTLKFNNGAN